MIITNTSPIYYLHQLGLLQLFEDIYGTVVTTSAVIQELNAGAAIGLSVPDVKTVSYIKVMDVSVPLFLQLIPDLGPGESSVIGLAIEKLNCTVILDDKLARKVANMNNINVTGTIGVLLLSKRLKLIDNVLEKIKTLMIFGFYCGESVMDEVRRLAGE
jgi:uncharacterized protein